MTTPLARFRDYPSMDTTYVEAMMREASPGLIVERVPYIAGHIAAYPGGVLRDESRAPFERYEPRMLDRLDDKVKRHWQQWPPD